MCIRDRLFNVLNFFQLQGLRKDLRAPHVPYSPPCDTPMCEEYTSCTPKGPPPKAYENPCSVIISDEEMEERQAQRAIAELEKRFNS